MTSSIASTKLARFFQRRALRVGAGQLFHPRDVAFGDLLEDAGEAYFISRSILFWYRVEAADYLCFARLISNDVIRKRLQVIANVIYVSFRAEVKGIITLVSSFPTAPHFG